MIAFVIGAATWTLLEYLIHRWMGHDRRFKKTPFGVEHVRHHIEGSYFAPSWKKIAFALVLGAVLVLLAGLAYTIGLLACYALYEVLHRRYHTHPGFGAYGRRMRRHHFHHHFVDGRVNHGVTSPIWDVLFGTYAPTAAIPVPRKLVMPWLVDAAGAIRTEHAGVYRLR